MKSPHKGIKRILKAFKYSYDGFIAAFKNEAAFRQDLIVFIIGLTAAIILPVSTLEKVLLISSLSFILFMELINSALEAVVDRISDEYHELSKRAKDIGSLIVLMSFANAIFFWSVILIKNFF